MKAAVLHGVNDLRYEEVPTPAIKAGEALIKVKAAGVCGSDVPRIMQKGTYKFPLIPGHEFSGEVVELAQNVTDVKIGDRATVIPLIPCLKCDYCQIGEYAQCDDYDYLGSRTDGGFAEYAKAPVSNLVIVPENVDLIEASLTEPAAVALHALRRTGVDAGDKVAILGAGPIGLMLAQWARIMGAGKIFLVDIVEEKLQFAQKLGFTDCINSREQDAVEAIMDATNGKGVDLAIEGAGAAITFRQCIQVARKLGKVIFMGNIETDVVLDAKTVSSILRKQIVMYGTWNSSFTCLPKNEWTTSLSFMNNGLNIKSLISHRFPLERAKEAIEMMFYKNQFFNRVVFVFD
ncbi:MAG: galactitol-1-phosphate 5-dehydrogenase [Candidatus Poribacteria bacterium]